LAAALRGDRRDRRAIQPQVDRVLRDQQAASYERLSAGPDGQPLIEVNLIPSLDADGSLLASVVLIRHHQAPAGRGQRARSEARWTSSCSQRRGILFHRDASSPTPIRRSVPLVGYTLERQGRLDDAFRSAATPSAITAHLDQLVLATNSARRPSSRPGLADQGTERRLASVTMPSRGTGCPRRWPA